jgi:amino-acid N-acetyltransferase
VTPAALPVLELRGPRSPGARPVLRLVRVPGHVRLRPAEPADAAAIHGLLQGFVEQQVMLPRSVAQIAAAIGEFIVAVEDGRVVGSAALRRYGPGLAEIGALAVATELHGAGIGRRLVEVLLDTARATGVQRVFALTLQEQFFERLGFRRTTIDEFPLKVAADCSTCARRHACAEITVAMTL